MTEKVPPTASNVTTFSASDFEIEAAIQAERMQATALQTRQLLALEAQREFEKTKFDLRPKNETFALSRKKDDEFADGQHWTAGVAPGDTRSQPAAEPMKSQRFESRNSFARKSTPVELNQEEGGRVRIEPLSKIEKPVHPLAYSRNPSGATDVSQFKLVDKSVSTTAYVDRLDKRANAMIYVDGVANPGAKSSQGQTAWDTMQKQSDAATNQGIRNEAAKMLQDLQNVEIRRRQQTDLSAQSYYTTNADASAKLASAAPSKYIVRSMEQFDANGREKPLLPPAQKDLPSDRWSIGPNDRLSSVVAKSDNRTNNAPTTDVKALYARNLGISDSVSGRPQDPAADIQVNKTERNIDRIDIPKSAPASNYIERPSEVPFQRASTNPEQNVRPPVGRVQSGLLVDQTARPERVLADGGAERIAERGLDRGIDVKIERGVEYRVEHGIDSVPRRAVEFNQPAVHAVVQQPGTGKTGPVGDGRSALEANSGQARIEKMLDNTRESIGEIVKSQQPSEVGIRGNDTRTIDRKVVLGSQSDGVVRAERGEVTQGSRPVEWRVETGKQEAIPERIVSINRSVSAGPGRAENVVEIKVDRGGDDKGARLNDVRASFVDANSGRIVENKLRPENSVETRARTVDVRPENFVEVKADRGTESKGVRAVDVRPENFVEAKADRGTESKGVRAVDVRPENFVAAKADRGTENKGVRAEEVRPHNLVDAKADRGGENKEAPPTDLRGGNFVDANSGRSVENKLRPENSVETRARAVDVRPENFVEAKADRGTENKGVRTGEARIENVVDAKADRAAEIKGTRSVDVKTETSIDAKADRGNESRVGRLPELRSENSVGAKDRNPENRAERNIRSERPLEQKSDRIGENRADRIEAKTERLVDVRSDRIGENRGERIEAKGERTVDARGERVVDGRSERVDVKSERLVDGKGEKISDNRAERTVDVRSERTIDGKTGVRVILESGQDRVQDGKFTIERGDTNDRTSRRNTDVANGLPNQVDRRNAVTPTALGDRNRMPDNVSGLVGVEGKSTSDRLANFSSSIRKSLDPQNCTGRYLTGAEIALAAVIASVGVSRFRKEDPLRTQSSDTGVKNSMQPAWQELTGKQVKVDLRAAHIERSGTAFNAHANHKEHKDSRDLPQPGRPVVDKANIVADRNQSRLNADDKFIADRINDRSNGERVIASRPIDRSNDRSNGENTNGDRLAVDRSNRVIIDNRLINDRANGDRAVNDRPVNDRAVNDRAVNDRAVNDRAVNDRAVNDRPINDRPGDRKNTADRTAGADRPAATERTPERRIFQDATVAKAPDRVIAFTDRTGQPVNRYITGAEIALATVIASVAISRVRQDRTMSDQLNHPDKIAPAQSKLTNVRPDLPALNITKELPGVKETREMTMGIRPLEFRVAQIQKVSDLGSTRGRAEERPVGTEINLASSKTQAMGAEVRSERSQAVGPSHDLTDEQTALLNDTTPGSPEKDDQANVSLPRGRTDLQIDNESLSLERRTADGDAEGPTEQKFAVLKRPTHIVAEVDTLVSIAEMFYQNPDVAWLIADLNVGIIEEHYMDEKRIVELRARQIIELPVWNDLSEFYADRSNYGKGDCLVTVVRASQLDLELINSTLSIAVGAGPSAQRSFAVPSRKTMFAPDPRAGLTPTRIPSTHTVTGFSAMFSGATRRFSVDWTRFTGPPPAVTVRHSGETGG